MQLSNEKPVEVKKNSAFYLGVLKKANVEYSFVFFNFALSYMLFPSILIQKVMTLFTSTSWNIFVIILAFNLGDVIGRSSTRLFHQTSIGYSRTFLAICSLARLIFVATSFSICFKDESDFWGAPGTMIINAFLVAITGGFFGVCSV